MHVLTIEVLKSKVLNCLVKTLELITLADHKYHINENIKQVRHQNGEIIIENQAKQLKHYFLNQSFL
jgi:hypothetical protein